MKMKLKRYCPSCGDSRVEKLGEMNGYNPTGKGGWKQRRIYVYWACKKCGHTWAEEPETKS